MKNACIFFRIKGYNNPLKNSTYILNHTSFKKATEIFSYLVFFRANFGQKIAFPVTLMRKCCVFLCRIAKIQFKKLLNFSIRDLYGGHAKAKARFFIGLDDDAAEGGGAFGQFEGDGEFGEETVDDDLLFCA